MVQAFRPNRSDDAFDIRILPRGTWCNEHLLNPESVDEAREISTVDAVAVTDQVPRCSVPGERLDELLSGPLRRGVFGYVGMQDSPSVVGQHQEHEENVELNGGDGEEVDGDQVFEVIIEE